MRYAEAKEDNTHNSYDGFQPLTARDVADMVYYTVSRPDHVNIQDILMFGTQQASATTIARTGKDAK